MFNCFKRKSKEIVPAKFGIIVPHTVKKQGATSKKGISEYKYVCDMVQYLASDIRHSFRDFDGVRGAASTLSNLGCNASLEPHLNAFNGKAKGFEILIIKNDMASKFYAEMFAQHFSSEFPERVLRHRTGIKEVSKGDRGYNNLKTAKKNGMEIALLSEAFFIDNNSEWISPEEMADFWNSLLY